MANRCLIAFILLTTVIQENILLAQSLQTNPVIRSFKDIPIDDSISVVGLGEFTHGGKEVILLKIDLVKYLIENKSFSLLLLECPDKLVRPINSYLLDERRTGEAEALVAKNFNGSFIVEEIVQLIDMLKSHNDSSPKKVLLKGIDVNTEIFPSNASLIHEYVLPYDYSRSATFLEDEGRIDDLTQFQRILEWAESNDNRLKNQMKTHDYNNFILDIKSAAATYSMRSKRNTTFIRDSAMAENARLLIQDKKAIVWAHNFHLMKGTDRFEKQNLGYYLDTIYGRRFFNILTDFYQIANLSVIGRDQAGSPVFTSKRYAPKRNSVSAKISIKMDLNQQTVILLQHEMAEYGSIRLNQIDMPGHHFTVGQSKSGPANFDALILLKDVSPTTLLQ